jgi:mannose-1-phosphate guanylyltransferase
MCLRAAASKWLFAVCLQDEILLNGGIVLPHKEIKESILEPGTIIM